MTLGQRLGRSDNMAHSDAEGTCKRMKESAMVVTAGPIIYLNSGIPESSELEYAVSLQSNLVSLGKMRSRSPEQRSREAVSDCFTKGGTHVACPHICIHRTRSAYLRNDNQSVSSMETWGSKQLGF